MSQDLSFRLYKYRDSCDLRIIFKKQKEAIAYRDANKGLKVFSFEISEGGRRNFMVTSAEEFSRFYLQCPTKFFYEIITEGSNCKLYFDIGKTPFNLEGGKLFSAQ